MCPLTSLLSKATVTVGREETLVGKEGMTTSGPRAAQVLLAASKRRTVPLNCGCATIWKARCGTFRELKARAVARVTCREGGREGWGGQGETCKAAAQGYSWRDAG